MKLFERWSILLSLGCLLNGVVFTPAIAERGRGRHGRTGFGAVDNPTYKEHCGACHFVYQPGLLPSGSWVKILSGLEDHHGAAVVIDADAAGIIRQYLEDNAAEHSSTKRSARIMRSLGGRTPQRITDVPYIRDEHHEIPAEVFNRESVESSSNCIACHYTAERGVYDDDYVNIPP